MFSALESVALSMVIRPSDVYHGVCGYRSIHKGNVELGPALPKILSYFYNTHAQPKYVTDL